MTSKHGKENVLDDNILIQIDASKNMSAQEKFEQEIASKIAGFQIAQTDSVKQKKVRQEAGTTTGRLVAMGEKAFERLKNKPKIGDIVRFKRYEGMDLDYEEGKKVWHKIMQDQAIMSIVDEE